MKAYVMRVEVAAVVSATSGDVALLVNVEPVVAWRHADDHSTDADLGVRLPDEGNVAMDLPAVGFLQFHDGTLNHRLLWTGQ